MFIGALGPSALDISQGMSQFTLYSSEEYLPTRVVPWRRRRSCWRVAVPTKCLSGGRMLRFAAAVLAVAAIAPTPAEKGLARLSEALASPAIVNNDVLWTRCGALDKIAPNPTTVVAAETPIAAGPSQSRCNDSHLAVGALGVMNGVEDRDRRANFLTRALSVEHPAVLPTAHSFSHEPTCSSYHTLACCTYGARRMQRFSPGCRRPWRHERGRGSRLTGQLSYTRALGRASCCAA